MLISITHFTNAQMRVRIFGTSASRQMHTALADAAPAHNEEASRTHAHTRAQRHVNTCKITSASRMLMERMYTLTRTHVLTYRTTHELVNIPVNRALSHLLLLCVCVQHQPAQCHARLAHAIVHTHTHSHAYANIYAYSHDLSEQLERERRFLCEGTPFFFFMCYIQAHARGICTAHTRH